MKKIAILAFALCLNNLIHGQNSQDSLSIELIKLSNTNHLVGFGVALVNKDSILYAKGFGYADKAT